MSPRALVVHASSHGQTRLIAEVVACELRAAGVEVTLHDALAAPPPPPDGFDVVVVGSRVHAGLHAPEVEAYVRLHHEALTRVPGAFFSVSLAVCDADPARRAGAAVAVDRFLAATAWQPRWRATFAGALRYRAYPWYLRWLMRRMAKAAGLSTDTARDHEYTDHAAVGRFAAHIVAGLRRERRGRARRASAEARAATRLAPG